MKRDKLDNLLRDKLDDLKVGPPADMWAKLDADLSKIRRAESFGYAETRQKDDIAESVAAANIRRPVKRKMNWAYVAASLAACVMLGVIMYKLDAVKDVLDQMAVLTEEEAADDNGFLTVPIMVEAGDADDIDNTAILAAAASGRRRSVVEDESQPVYKKPEEIYSAIHREREDEEFGDKEPVIAHDAEAGRPDTKANKNSTEATAGDKNAEKAVNRNKTSDIGRREEFAVLSRGRAEMNRRPRRTTPINTSVFAVNSGGFGGNNAVQVGTRLSTSSSLLVSEADIYGSYDMATVNKLKHDYPLTFGASVGIGITHNLSIETGLMYTYMKSEAEQGGSGRYEYDIKQKLHYLGIPVKIKYDFLKHRRVDLYVSAGGTFEKLISGNVTITTKSQSGSGQKVSDKEKIKTNNIQTSLGSNVGVEFKVDKTFGIYLEPGVSYYIKSSCQPDSYRKDNPLSFTLRAGFRINL